MHKIAAASDFPLKQTTPAVLLPMTGHIVMLIDSFL